MPPADETVARDPLHVSLHNSASSTAADIRHPDDDYSVWNGNIWSLYDAISGASDSLTPSWLDSTLHAARLDINSDDLLEEENEEENHHHRLDEAMPDIQRGSLFDTSTIGVPPAYAQPDTEHSFPPPPDSQASQHRQPYSDPNSFVYGEPTWASPAFASHESPSQGMSAESNRAYQQTPSLRRSAALSSSIRNRRAEVQPRVPQPFPINTENVPRNRSTSPGPRQTPAEQREIAIANAAWDRQWRMNSDRESEYTGWAPGTATPASEYQRPNLSVLRSLARGSRGSYPPQPNVNTTGPTTTRSPAMTALERRYWAEQERQRRHRAVLAGEQEAASRRIQVRDQHWGQTNTAEMPSNAPTSDVPVEVPNPRSISYNRTSDRYASMRSDIYDIHRNLEEMNEDEGESAALNRRARRELQRARRAHPLDEIRRDELRQGLYNLHRDANASGEPTRRCIEEAIKYLEKLRICESSHEAYRAAENGGLIHHGRAACDLADFIFDTRVVKKTPVTSWLVPGTRFSGFQHSVTTSALPYTMAGSSTIRIRNPTEYPHVSRIPTATASSNPNSSTFRPSWIESVIQRDRHTGASSHHSSPLTAATAPLSSINSSLMNAAAANAQPRTENEDTWPVKVTITSVDYENSTLTGTMEAMNVPSKTGTASHSGNSPEQTTITTFLEGEIIDLNRHSLETCGFNADSVVDSTYWRRLEPFKSLSDKEMPSRLVSSEWLSSKIGPEWVLMRWKEKCFVTPSDAGMGLTISGFYYISLHRETGKIEGLYYDPQSSPYQHLCLEPTRARQSSTYEFR